MFNFYVFSRRNVVKAVTMFPDSVCDGVYGIMTFLHLVSFPGERRNSGCIPEGCQMVAGGRSEAAERTTTGKREEHIASQRDARPIAWVCPTPRSDENDPGGPNRVRTTY